MLECAHPRPRTGNFSCWGEWVGVLTPCLTLLLGSFPRSFGQQRGVPRAGQTPTLPPITLPARSTAASISRGLSGRGKFLGGCSPGKQTGARLAAQLAPPGKEEGETLSVTHSLPRRRETRGRGTPAAPRSSRRGLSWPGCARTAGGGAAPGAGGGEDRPLPAPRARGK